MTDINDAISKINHYQYDIKKGAIDELAKLDTRKFIDNEIKIFKGLLDNKRDTKVGKKIIDILFNKMNISNQSFTTDDFLEKIELINKVSMVYDKSFIINLNCKYHVFYSGKNIKIENIMSYNCKTLDINEGNNLIILDRHNTHARIINYDNNEVNYIDIPRRNFALSPEKLIHGSKYTLNDEVNDVKKMNCNDDSNVPWLCNGLYHSIYHSIKNVKDSDNLNIVVPMINIEYGKFKKIDDEMEKLLKEENDTADYYEISREGKKVPHNKSIFSDCTVRVIKKGNKSITIIGLVLFDRINYIYNIFKDDISDDYNDVIDKFTNNDDVFDKIKNNYTKFPNFVYKMCCLNYAIKYYLDYKTNINDLYYVAKLVFFSCFNNHFGGKIDKKNITELTTDEQNIVASTILDYHKNKKILFTVNVDDSNRDWFNLDDLINKFKYISGDYKTYTGNITLSKIGDSKKDKLDDVILKYLKEIRNEISHLRTAHDDFETMINSIIENGSIPQSIPNNNKTMDTIKQIIEKNTGKLVCIPVFYMNRYTSSFNYKLMKSIINKINEKIKKEAGVKEDTP